MILPDSLWVLAVRAVIIIIIIITGWRSVGLLRERIRKYFLWKVCHYGFILGQGGRPRTCQCHPPYGFPPPSEGVFGELGSRSARRPSGR